MRRKCQVVCRRAATGKRDRLGRATPATGSSKRSGALLACTTGGGRLRQCVRAPDALLARADRQHLHRLSCQQRRCAGSHARPSCDQQTRWTKWNCCQCGHLQRRRRVWLMLQKSCRRNALPDSAMRNFWDTDFGIVDKQDGQAWNSICGLHARIGLPRAAPTGAKPLRSTPTTPASRGGPTAALIPGSDLDIRVVPWEDTGTGRERCRGPRLETAESSATSVAGRSPRPSAMPSR